MSRERKVSIICHSIALAIVIAMMIFLCFKNSDGVYYDLAIDQAIGNANKEKPLNNLNVPSIVEISP